MSQFSFRHLTFWYYQESHYSWKVITPVRCLNITQGTFINLSPYPHNPVSDKVQATKCYIISPEFNKHGPKLNSGLLTSDSFPTNHQRFKSVLYITKPQVFLRHLRKIFLFLWAYENGSERGNSECNLSCQQQNLQEGHLNKVELRSTALSSVSKPPTLPSHFQIWHVQN